MPEDLPIGPGSEGPWAQASPQVGIIGLGAMGNAIARRLVAVGLRPVVHDIRPEAIDAAVTEGAIAGSATEAAGCGVLMTSLPTESSVLDTLTPELLGELRGGVLVELSTITPGVMREVAARAAVAGAAVIDCPISGGPDNALSGTLVCLAGATTAGLDRARDVLAHLGTVDLVGEVGDGKAVKLINNMISIGNLLMASEAFALAARLGLDQSRVLEVLAHSGARSHMLSKKLPVALGGDFTPGFAVRLAAKDLRLAIQSGEAAESWLPLTHTADQVLAAAEQQGLGEQDMSIVLRMFAEAKE